MYIGALLLVQHRQMAIRLSAHSSLYMGQLAGVAADGNFVDQPPILDVFFDKNGHMELYECAPLCERRNCCSKARHYRCNGEVGNIFVKLFLSLPPCPTNTWSK